ncbi:MAG: hypothetical protein IJF15_00915 [Oscillospiraceae bacterium]|nr:hypothetical protein [Oscillospiraceae bacterium]
MGKRWINAMQNTAIVLLFALMLALMTQVQGAGQKDIGAFFESFPTAAAPSQPAGVGEAVGRGVAPVRIVLTGSYGRCGYTQITTHSEVYESAGTLLSEAVGSAGASARVSVPTFERALSGSGIYFDFICALPSELLFERVLDGGDGALSAVRRIFLTTDGAAQNVSLYVEDEGQGLCVFPTAVSSVTLADYLASVEEDNVSFAFELEDAQRLEPYTILPAKPPTLFVLAAANPLAAGTRTDALLSALDFNPHTQSRYTETSGASVILGDDRSLRIHPDGTVRFEGSADDPCALLRVDAASGMPTLSEISGACRTLLETLLAATETQLYLSAASREGDTARLAFDYMVDGTPVRFSDGLHAAELFVEGGTIARFSLRFRSYTPQAETAQLLPTAQVLPIASRYERSEPTVCYLDGGGERVNADWIGE